MIEEGKDKIEWTRQVDPAKLNTLKQLMMEDNFKDNMSTLIKTIYEFAFLTYSGNFSDTSDPSIISISSFIRFTSGTNQE